jgi:CDGSH-type Zn-finger protein
LKNTKTPASNSKAKIIVSKNGPYVVSGNVPLFTMIIECDKHGVPVRWVKGENFKTSENYGLCRCGQSKNKPFCDGTHVKINFDGSETSDIVYTNKAKKINGPELILSDIEILCASARFCHRGGDIWANIRKSDDPTIKQIAVDDACDCPSGRLIVADKKMCETIEPELGKSIGVIEDPSICTGGPFWIRGAIPIYSADGKLYEVRNRMTLCRCGKSTNKPFCDSSHYPEEDREV